MTANIMTSYNSSYINHMAPKSQKGSRYQNLHKNFVDQQQYNYVPQNPYANNQRRQVNFQDLRAMIDKPKPTLEKHKFQGLSTYVYDYTQKEAGRQGKYKHPDNLTLGNQAFKGITQYTDNLKGLNPSTKAEKYTLPQNQIFPKGTFQDHSTYVDSYIPNQAKRQAQFKPVGQLRVGEGRFDGSSSYLHDYSRIRGDVRPEKIIMKNNDILPKGNFQGDSTYHDAYISSKIQMNKKIIPQSQLKVGGKFQGQSSYVNDFNYKQSPKVQKVKPRKNDAFPKGKFQGQSCYTGAYIGQQGEKSRQFRPQQQWKVEGKFQGNSSYVNDFKGHLNGIRAQKIVLPNNQIMPQGRFQTNTNYHDNYLPNHAIRQKQFRPQGQLKVGQGNFQGHSSYLYDYQSTGHAQAQQIFKPQQNKIMPEGKFQTHTNYQDNYLPNQAIRQKQFRPQGQLKVGQGNFEGLSSYVYDYQNMGNPQLTEKFKPHSNKIMPEGRFQTNTNYQDNYLPNHAIRQKQFRPQGQLKVGQGNFEGHSSYSNDYQSTGNAQVTQKFRPHQNQIMPKGRFQGNTSYQQNYIQTKGQRGQSFKPRPQLEIGGKFEGLSSYTGDYNQKKGIRSQRVPLPINQVLPDGKFVGQTNYTNSYVNNPYQKVQKVIMKPQLTVGQGKFQGNTTYQQNHQGYYIKYNQKNY